MSIKQTISYISPSIVDSHSIPLANMLSFPPFPSSTISTPSWTTTELPAFVHVSTTIPFIVSVDISVYAHRLQEELPDSLFLTQIARLWWDP